VGFWAASSGEHWGQTNDFDDTFTVRTNQHALTRIYAYICKGGDIYIMPNQYQEPTFLSIIHNLLSDFQGRRMIYDVGFSKERIEISIQSDFADGK
jgi:hypothetical protein